MVSKKKKKNNNNYKLNNIIDYVNISKLFIKKYSNNNDRNNKSTIKIKESKNFKILIELYKTVVSLINATKFLPGMGATMTRFARIDR